MSNPSSQVSESPDVQPDSHPAKLNKLIIQLSTSLIVLFFSGLFLIILINLPGAF